VLHVRNANVMLLEHLVPGMQMQSTEFERKNGVGGGGLTPPHGFYLEEVIFSWSRKSKSNEESNLSPLAAIIPQPH
jgi:hypothetical protein